VHARHVLIACAAVRLNALLFEAQPVTNALFAPGRLAFSFDLKCTRGRGGGGVCERASKAIGDLLRRMRAAAMPPLPTAIVRPSEEVVDNEAGNLSTVSGRLRSRHIAHTSFLSYRSNR
jgi:hypothetical protein